MTLARRAARASGEDLRALGFTMAAVRALRAGVDVVLMPDDVRAAHSAIVAAVSEGRLPAARLAVGGTETDRDRLEQAASADGLSVGSGDLVRLLGGGWSGSGVVVVALDTPYALADSDATTARIALFGRTPAAFRALTDVLTGAATGGGTLPVGVRDVERSGCR
jgi:beta-N-acetylhexosaminidase